MFVAYLDIRFKFTDSSESCVDELIYYLVVNDIELHQKLLY